MLGDLLEKHLNLRPKQLTALHKLGLRTVRDLLYRFPARYEEAAHAKCIADLLEKDAARVTGRVVKSKLEKTFRKRVNIAEVTLADGTGNIRAVWFNQPYVANILKEGVTATIAGQVRRDKKGLYIANPDYALESKEVLTYEFDKDARSPIYPESGGISSRWFQYAARKLLAKLQQVGLVDHLPAAILEKYHLPSLEKALVYIHSPKDAKSAEAARKRFAFEEIFLIQLSRQRERMFRDREPSFAIEGHRGEEMVLNLPFTLTPAQNRVTREILEGLSGDHPMSRLLEGDVGSGKTAVALVASYATIASDYQVAYMVPTEILGRQHFADFCERFAALGGGVNIGLLTSAECLKFPSKSDHKKPTHISRAQLLKWVVSGEIQILIGTHALVQEAVRFKKLALVIIDEQHKFGVGQRLSLTKKNQGVMPHLLSMTATPIPRTLALTIYGDLDLSLLDEMPPSRKKVVTEIVTPAKRSDTYEFIRGELAAGRQCYVVCPRIDPPDEKVSTFITVNARAVKDEYEKLAEKIFPEFVVGMIHGKMKPKKKEEIMAAFRAGAIKILVSTSVIEVGVNVPNATMIVIEGAERFGLAQLHQLRGRVLRGTHQPYCFVFTDSRGESTRARLKALATAKNGFALAEFDLMNRGAGELVGSGQSGISDLAMEAIKNIKMVEAARTEARALLEKDLELSAYPFLQSLVAKYDTHLHLE
ncbi:MAG: ATP-dependent DNA helicase RecG [Candidatus Niyogibacteria bacterium]|nr:ATP-dependent DNA helicase RecG [Candidatus Niyogibacteria bacterium]